VVVETVFEVLVSVSVTVAPAMTAPFGSVTTPVTEDEEEVTWAETASGSSSRRSSDMTSEVLA